MSDERYGRFLTIGQKVYDLLEAIPELRGFELDDLAGVITGEIVDEIEEREKVSD